MENDAITDALASGDFEGGWPRGRSTLAPARTGARGGTPPFAAEGREADAAADGQVPTLTLWRRCAAGADDREWDELHLRLIGRLRNWLQRGLAGPFRNLEMPEADDLAQDVFCRLLANRRRALRRCRADSEGELMAYLARICSSVLVTAARRRGALKRRAAHNGSWNEIDEEEVAAPGLDPEERALIADLRHKATSCTNDLCPVVARRQRFILDQVLFVGYTSSELSRSLGVSASSIDTTVSRARRRAGRRGIPFPCRRSPGRPVGGCRSRIGRPG